MEDHNNILEANQGMPGDQLLSSRNKYQLDQLAKYARWTSIILLSLLGLFILILIFFGGTFLTNLGMGSAGTSALIIPLIIYGIIFAFAIYLYYLVYAFGTKTRNALKTNNEDDLYQGFWSLRRVFKVSFFFMMIYVVLILIMLLFFGSGFLFGAMG